MLTDLHIVNFALIENQEISFHPGLNVLSGETGAGKSIILQAVQFLMGAKPKVSPIRTATECCEVHGTFDLSRVAQSILEELPDIAREGEGELLVSRSLSRSGKSKVFMNGRLAPLSVLDEVMQRLIHVCGQNHQVRLLEPRYHLDLLDSYAGLSSRADDFRKSFSAWRMDAERLEALRADASKQDERRERLSEIVSELEPLDLYPGVRADLEAQLKKITNAERLLALGSLLDAELDGDGGMISQGKRVASLSHELTRLDPGAAPLGELFFGARAALTEFHAELRRYISGLEIDEENAGALRERLAEVARVERKYRASDDALIELLHKSAAELSSSGSASDMAGLERQVEEERRQLESRARDLRALRQEAARALVTAVCAELAELSMPGVAMDVVFEEIPLCGMGMDKIEIVMSANRGQPLKSLKSVASGGELSRIMLVLKKALRDQMGVNVLVFDEVDTGISGGVARAVGEKLKSLAAYSQVFCITHLPQVASMADHHFIVDKQVFEDSTRSAVRELSIEERVDEVARMLAGYHITAAARESARELISTANNT